MVTIQSPDQGTSRFADLHQALHRAAAEARGTLLRADAYRTAWMFLAFTALAFALDLAFALPPSIRWLILIGLVGFVAYWVYRMTRAQRGFRSSDDWAARAVEERIPDADNALINGVQFERVLAGHDQSGAHAELMRREVERARRTTARIGDASTVIDRRPEHRALRALVTLAIVWMLIAVLFPSGFRAVVPRIFAPWMDDVTPPWSMTHFDVQPQGAKLRFGDSVQISVTLSGQMPVTVALQTRARGQSAWQTLEMNEEERGVYSVTIDSVSGDLQYYVQSETGRSARYWITVVRPPVATGLTVTYTPPKYTGRAPYQQTVGADGLHGLQGTVARLDVASNRELSGAVLHVTPDGEAKQDIALAPGGGKSASTALGQFTIDRPGVFSIDLTALDGQTTPNALSGKIVLDRDQKPNVWIPSPGHDLLVTASMAIPVRIEAEDPNSLSSMMLHRSIDDLDDSPVSYPLAGQPKSADRDYSFSLADLGVRPGDTIQYYAEAADNHPGLPDIGESETYTLTVVTSEQFQKALQEQRTASAMRSEAQDMVAATDRLAEEQRALARKMSNVALQLAKKPGDAALQKQMKDLQAQQKQLAQQASTLAKQMKDYAKSPSGTAFEQALKAKVAQVARKLAQAAAQMRNASSSGRPQSAADQAQQASSQLATASSQVHAQVQKAVEQLAKMWSLYNDVERFFALLTAQGELVLHARQFQNGGSLSPSDRAELRDLADSQDKSEQTLVQLQADFRTDADQAARQFPHAAAAARGIAADIDQRRIPSLMSAARDAFLRNDGPTGYQHASDALAQMKAMVHEAQGAQGQMQGELSDSLSLTLGKQGLGQSLSQLAGSGYGTSGQNGLGIGIGGMPGSANGMPGGSVPAGSNSTPQPFTPQTSLMNGTGGNEKLRHQNTIPGAGAPLSPTDVEVTSGTANKPVKAGTQNANGFPAQYRKLISDYYRSVANGQ